MISSNGLRMRALSFWRVTAVFLVLVISPVQAAVPGIAVLLPESGRMAKAAEAIRNGLLAAYYQDSSGSTEPPSLHFYNSADRDVAALLLQARERGAGFVIGPLDREHIETLAKQGKPPLPVLALNHIELHADNIVQFALSPEDELLKVVSWMRSAKIRNPLLLAASDEPSQRQLKIFQSLWLAADNEASLRVLILDPSRKGGITAFIKDLVRGASKHDALFLATPALARQVQPALTYYHSTLPLYSLSSAWDPTADATGKKDLDGLRFCDLPWMLDTDLRPEQQELYDSGKRPAGGYDRLYAFGADAWTMTRHWPALLQGDAIALRSGVIQLDDSRRLRRIPTCAEVRNGIAHPAPTKEAGSS
jgi:outer membrane PBP1 activator LpoA protein